MAAVLDVEHPSADAAAKAAIKVIAEALGHRNLYTIAHPDPAGGRPMLMGLYSSQKEAEKGLSVHGMVSDRVQIMPLYGDSEIHARLEGRLMPGDCECRHSPHMHLSTMKKRRCMEEGCDCTNFAKFDWPITASQEQ